MGKSGVPVAIRAFETPNGGKRIAALQSRFSDNRPIVRLLNGNTGAIISNVSYLRDQEALDLIVVPDTSLDGNDSLELGVLVNSIAGTRLRVRDSVTKALIQSLNIP